MSSLRSFFALFMLLAVLATAVYAGGYPDSGYYTCGCTDGGDGSKYCWAACNMRLTLEPWCWTTKSYSQSYQYVKCDTADDCNCDWSCASPCG